VLVTYGIEEVGLSIRVCLEELPAFGCTDCIAYRCISV
jgi:hypothetical protein